jgi:glutathione S-transferase
LTFPNLPYLIDGDFKITESRAICHYIIKKSGKTDLLGKNIQDEAKVESVIGVVTDLRHALAPLVFDPEWKSKIAGVIAKGTPKLE